MSVALCLEYWLIADAVPTEAGRAVAVRAGQRSDAELARDLGVLAGQDRVGVRPVAHEDQLAGLEGVQALGLLEAERLLRDVALLEAVDQEVQALGGLRRCRRSGSCRRP